MPLCGLRVERRRVPFDPTLVLIGEMDAAAVGAVDAVLASEVAATRGDLGVDLSRLDFIGLEGVDMLVTLAHRMAAERRRLRVAATSPLVDRVLEIAGVELGPARLDGHAIPARRTDRVPGACGRPPGTHHTAAGRAACFVGEDTLMYDDFTITFTDSHDDVVELAVAGELDPVTAPALSEALQVVARRGATIVANMAAVTFIDSRALKVLLDTHQALTSLGGRLCLADPSPSTRRLLELTGLRDHFAAPPPDVRRADVVGSERRLRRLISELAGLVLGATSLRDDLEQLIRFSCQVLPGCDAGSITLLVDGSPTTVAVHERAALELDMIQYDNGEGPCLTALTGQRIRVDIVPVDERFPHFAARAAADHRINSVLSTPIVHRDEVVGSLNFYSYEPHAFDATAEDITVLASSQAAHAITRSEVFTAARQRRDQLQAHYDETVLVARAQGALIATHQCSAEQARTLIHDAAAATGDDLVTVAHRILDAARRHATSSSTHIAASRPDPSDDHDRSDPGSSQHRRDDGSAAD